ncbi:AI-2E family transporter [Geminicoccus roseus]|uniref:AI-2E family transporter n=1 Tax=Geminicoccus roseus TaxID=404900 RepID=UPI0003FD61AC|nr:AI-2E family transporter [Geminicoccus roseus]
MPEPTSAWTRRLLAVIALVLVTMGLRATYSVTMPLAVACVIIAAVWPVKPWLDRVLPSKLSYAGTILVLLLVLGGFTASVYFSALQVMHAFSQNWDRFEAAYSSASDMMDGLDVQLGSKEGYQRLIGFGQSILSNAYTIFVYLGFIALLVILGLPEVPALQRKLRDELHFRERREVVQAAGEISAKIRSYLGVTTLTSLITGVACAVWSVVTGLELFLVWGLLNFLLNYIPVVGNLVGIVPPTLYAIIQYDGWTMPAVVFAGFLLIQLAVSNFVYPMLQGHSLSLSPIAIVVMLAFWSWVWGIAGALIAIPVTTTLVIVCEHFPATRWIATLLSNPRRP